MVDKIFEINTGDIVVINKYNRTIRGTVKYVERNRHWYIELKTPDGMIVWDETEGGKIETVYSQY